MSTIPPRLGSEAIASLASTIARHCVNLTPFQIETAARIALGAIAPDTATVNLTTEMTANPHRDVDAPMDIREEIAQSVRSPVRIAADAIRVRPAAHVGFHLR